MNADPHISEALGSPLDQRALNWLQGHGVDHEAITQPWPLRTGRVVFGEGRAELNRLGDFSFVLPLMADDGIADAIAWAPGSGRLATFAGIGAALGQAQIGWGGLGTIGRPVCVWRSPLGWLKAGRRGLVIVDIERAAHVLAGVAIEAEDADHAADLRRALVVPPPVITAHSNRRAAA